MRIVERRERWGLTWLGRLVVLGVALAATVGFVLGAHPFLAVKQPAPADFLVVEGWVPERVFWQVADLFRTGGYERVVIVVPTYPGDPVIDPYGVRLDDYLADWIAMVGVPRSKVDVILSPSANRDRTYHAAKVVRQWLEEQGRSLSTIVLVTLGPHARRSRLLYRMALGDDVVRGVIPLYDDTYDPQHWWRSSAGVRTVLSEALAYVYAKLVFREPPPPPEGYSRVKIPENDR